MCDEDDRLTGGESAEKRFRPIGFDRDAGFGLVGMIEFRVKCWSLGWLGRGSDPRNACSNDNLLSTHFCRQRIDSNAATL